jgi:uncharacterized RDD family membrane protein YckC
MGQVIAERLDTTFLVETPEHIAFSFQLAGPGRRAAAYLIDLMVRGAAGMLLFFAFLFAGYANPLGDDGGGIEQGLALVIFFFMEWGYFVAFEVAMAGRSPGKAALKLRVIRKEGTPVSFSDSLLRNLLRAADMLPNVYALGLVTMLSDQKFRRLGDLVAGTIVVFEPKTRVAPYLLQERAQKVPELPSRIALTGSERAAIGLLMRRRPALSEARAQELAELLAPKLAQRLGVTAKDPIAFLSAVYERVAH